MKAVILAGGLGTRICEETDTKPKPMVEIGGKPIIWHIMKTLSTNKINDFIICCGYKGYLIKEYFANYFLHTCDVTFDFCNENKVDIHKKLTEEWKVTLVDTGELTQTAGRLKRVVEYLNDEPFLFTYGDGLSDVNTSKILEAHIKNGCLVTMTAVQPPGRYGAVEITEDKVFNFLEKPQGDNSWINGGFFIVNPQCIDAIEGDSSIWEKDILPDLASSGKLGVYAHKGFWKAMDTLRDKRELDNMWNSGQAPWKKWD